MKKRNPITLSQLLYLAAAALFLFFTGGRYNFWLAAWFTSVFFIRFARKQGAFKGYILIAGVSWGVTVFTWSGIQPAGGLFHIINMLVAALFSSLPILADRMLSPKLPKFARTLVFPIFSTALEYFMISGNPMGSFGSLAYTQYGNLPLIQIVSFAGMMSITFLISWFASVANELWEANWKIRSARATALSFALAIIFVYVYGGLRLIKPANIPAEEGVSTSMIIRSNGDTSLRDIMSEQGEERFRVADTVFESFIAHSLLEDDADIICWPEGAVVTRQTSFPEKDQRLRVFSKAAGQYLVAPFFIIPEEGQVENKVVLYTPAGQSAFSHTKYGGNMFEGSVAGDGSIQYTDSPFGRLSALICWDMDFPSPVRQAGASEVDILFSPSSEWREIVPVHAQMAVFRGIENGVSTVHPATLGLSVIADPYGREITSVNWYKSNDTVARGTVSRRGIKTVYSAIGDIFPQMVLLAAALIVGYVLANKLRVMAKKRKAKSANRSY